jgi:hypothetical protein
METISARGFQTTDFQWMETISARGFQTPDFQWMETISARGFPTTDFYEWKQFRHVVKVSLWKPRAEIVSIRWTFSS